MNEPFTRHPARQIEVEIVPQALGQAEPMDLILELPGGGAWFILEGTREELLELALRIIDELPRKTRA